MRKVLFWILMIVLLFLLVVLGVSFRTNRTPLNVLTDWTGTKSTSIQIEETQTETGSIDTWDAAAKREIIRQKLEAQQNRIQTTESETTSTGSVINTATWTEDATTSSTQTKPTTTSSRDKENKAAKDFVNNLVVD